MTTEQYGRPLWKDAVVKGVTEHVVGAVLVFRPTKCHGIIVTLSEMQIALKNCLPDDQRQLFYSWSIEVSSRFQQGVTKRHNV